MPNRKPAWIVAALASSLALQPAVATGQDSNEIIFESFRVVCLDGMASPTEIPALARKRGLEMIAEDDKAYISHLWAGRAGGKRYFINFSNKSLRCDIQIEGISGSDIRLWLVRVVNVRIDDLVSWEFEGKYKELRLRFSISTPVGQRAFLSVSPSDSNAWKFNEEVSRVVDTKRTFIWKKSTEELRDESGLKYWPHILIQCSAGTTYVWLNFDRIMSSNGQNVAFKIGSSGSRVGHFGEL